VESGKGIGRLLAPSTLQEDDKNDNYTGTSTRGATLRQAAGPSAPSQ